MTAEAVDAALARIDAEYKSDDFIHNRDVDVPRVGPVRLFRKPDAGTELGIWRAEATIRCVGGLDAVEQTMWHSVPVLRDYEKLQSFRIIEQAGDHARVVYERSWMPWPLDPREFVYVQAVRREEKAFTWLAHSVPHPDFPVAADGEKQLGADGVEVVRGDLWAGMRIEVIDDSTFRAVNVGRIDPKGVIPHGVIELFTDRQAMFLGKLQDVLEGRLRRFIVGADCAPLYSAPSAGAAVAAETAAKYCDGKAGGGVPGIAEGTEIESEEMTGKFPHDAEDTWVKTEIKLTFGEDRSFWVQASALKLTRCQGSALGAPEAIGGLPIPQPVESS